MAIPRKGKRRSEKEKKDLAILNYRGQEDNGTIYRDGKIEGINWLGK